MKGDFFNRIGVADMERVHSAVIGWMLSNDCKALTPQQKSELLCGLFDVKPIRQFGTFRVEVEHHNIDLVIITDENTSNATCWVIENKIKSSQHSNQLDKYVDIVQGKQVKIGRITHKITDYVNMAQHFCFLTLIGEDPQCSRRVVWEKKTYDDLGGLLNNYSLSHNSSTDAVILNEYLECIKNLTDAINDFLSNHQNYPNVFIDGVRQKNPKIKTNGQANGTYADFIAENGLETIFQKCFLSHIMKKTNYFKTGFSILETHGTALAENKKWKTVNKTELGIQFQDGTFKVQVVGPSSLSTISFWKHWDQVFPKLQNCNGWQRNESKNRKGPYFSYSIRKNKCWYANDVVSIANEWDRMFNDCLVVRQELETYC